MKKSIKKLLALTLTGAFLVGALTGCGKSGEDDKTITVQHLQHHTLRFWSMQRISLRSRAMICR